MSSFNNKICLVGLPVDLSKKYLTNFLQSKFHSKNFTLELKMKSNGRNHGWGLVVTPDANLYKSILRSRKLSINGRKFFSKRYMEREELIEFKREFNQRRLFLKKLPDEIKNEELAAIFERFGGLEDVYSINSAKQSKKSKAKNERRRANYGFVVFTKKSDAVNMLKIGSISIQGMKVPIEQYRPRKEMFKMKPSKGKRQRARHQHRPKPYSRVGTAACIELDDAEAQLDANKQGNVCSRGDITSPFKTLGKMNSAPYEFQNDGAANLPLRIRFQPRTRLSSKVFGTPGPTNQCDFYYPGPHFDPRPSESQLQLESLIPNNLIEVTNPKHKLLGDIDFNKSKSDEKINSKILKECTEVRWNHCRSNLRINSKNL